MKYLEITKDSFLEWYFNSGDDQMQIYMRNKVGESVIEALLKTGRVSFSVEQIFEEEDKNEIPLVYCEEYDLDVFDDIYLGEIGDYELKLID